MKGVVLAGGKGSRLYPLTKITNKHLLPVYDRPMIYYPVQTLVDAGIRDILIVTGGNHCRRFSPLLGNGREFGLTTVNYTYQEGEGGIADALKLAEDFAEGQKICVILGDNIIQKGIARGRRGVPPAGARRQNPPEGSPRSPSVSAWPRLPAAASFASKKSPSSRNRNYAVTGIYMYDGPSSKRRARLTPSARGELEITDVNNAYIGEGTMTLRFPRWLVDRRRHF